MRTSRFSEEQIIRSLKEVEAGRTIPELCREMGISDATFTPGAGSMAGWKSARPRS